MTDGSRRFHISFLFHFNPFSILEIRLPRILRGSTRVKSYNLVISLIARFRARLIRREALGSFAEPFLPLLPFGTRPGGFFVFETVFVHSNFFSANKYRTARGNAGSGSFFWAGTARGERVVPAFSILVNRFIHNQKNG